MKLTAAALESIARLAAQGRVVDHGRAASVAPIEERISEREFMAAVIDLARRNGWLHYHTTDSRKSAAGFPDLVLLRADVLIVAELKVGDNVPTADQLRFLDAFRAAGVKVFLWRPHDWPTIVATLN